ncbi:MAG: UDP-2,3-diacylglucosamine diphosphatase LpxI [Pseudomonadota bacterium]
MKASPRCRRWPHSFWRTPAGTFARRAMHEHAGPATPLAVVAGRGDLPRQVAERRASAGLPYVLIIFPECHEDWMDSHPSERHRFERLGAVFRSLAAHKASHIVLAGAMNRPRLQFWRIDFKTLIIAFRALPLLRRGDDTMLRGYASMIEAEGFSLISPHEILGKASLVPPGALGKETLDATARSDAARAAAIVDALGPLDVGQGAVVGAGLCLGVEAIEGTDLMLDRIAALPPERRSVAAPPCGVLFKGPKPNQDRRIDLPAIGPRTVAGAARAGLSGIVVAAGATTLLEAEETRRAADKERISIYGAEPQELLAWRKTDP